jgi:hypothetical protein
LERVDIFIFLFLSAISVPSAFQKKLMDEIHERSNNDSRRITRPNG